MENKYTRLFNKIEAVLETWLPETPDSSWVERVFGSRGQAVSLEMAASLTRPGRDLLKRGGKRWRPLLMVLAAESIAGESGVEAALPLTPLVEFPHTASLIHDDIEDNSDMRRGKPAVHLLYGTDTAINGGAFLYFLPLACLSAWANDTLPGRETSNLKDQIWTAWASYMRVLHLGQAMDIAWHRDFNSLPTLDEYDRMCRFKTGCLARLAAVLGVYCAGSSGTAAFTAGDGFPGHDLPREFHPGEAGKKGNPLKTLADVFGEAAEQLGVGFQILDDVKNLGAGSPGKKRGDDIVEGKKSFPILLYLHRYPEKLDFAARCFTAARAGGAEAPEVEEIISALERAGILEEAREKGMEYVRASREVFSGFEAEGYSLKKEGRDMLVGLVDLLY